VTTQTEMKQALDTLRGVICRAGTALNGLKQAREAGDDIMFEVLQDAARRELNAGLDVFEFGLSGKEAATAN